MKKIFVLNNDPEMCCSLALIFRDRYDVISITNTEDVRSILGHVRIDLILADVDTPKGNIIQNLRWVKENFPNIRIVMFYIYFQDREMEEGVIEIADACIQKPFDHEEVLEVLEEELSKAGKLPEAAKG